MAIFIFLYLAIFFFEDNFLGINHWGDIIASKYIIIYMTLPIYDQIAHLKDIIYWQRVNCMHSEFRSSSEHDEVGAGKVGGMMKDRKEIAIILARDVVYPSWNVAMCTEKEMNMINV